MKPNKYKLAAVTIQQDHRFTEKQTSMQKILLMGLLLSMLTTQAQKTMNDDNAVKREARGFHAIAVADGIDLYLSQGNEEAVAVSAAEQEYRDRIQVEVREGVLRIYLDKKMPWGFSWNNKHLKAYVSFKNLDKLKASGGSDVLVDGTLNLAALDMELSGGSDFKGTVKAETFTLSASGGSDARISGSAGKLVINANGGSDVHAYDLVTDYCTVASSGGSDVFITVNKELTGSASGGSDIHYKGTASSTARKSGGSDIKKVS